MHLQVRESDTFVLSIRDPRYVKVDERLERGSEEEEGLGAENWRGLRIPESRNPVSEELVSVLSRPIVFTVSEGEIRSAKVAISKTFYEQILRTKVFCTTFLWLQFGSVIFWQNNIDAKAPH